MIYVIDDDSGVLGALSSCLELLALDFIAFQSVSEFNEHFRQACSRDKPEYFCPSRDILIVDYLLPEITALGLLKLMNEYYETTTPIKIIIISGLDEDQIEAKNPSQFDYYFLPKPFGLDDLEYAIASLRVPKAVQATSLKP